MDFSIAKQPIVDLNMEVVGYELLYRATSSAKEAVITEETNATDNVLSGYFLLNLYTDDLSKNTCFINCEEGDLYSEKLTMLPPETTVVEILETCVPSPELIDQILHLKQLGYRIAFDDLVPNSIWNDYLHIADIAKVDVLAYGSEDLSPIIHLCKKYQVKLLAEKVENEEKALYFRDLGFDYFQGYYFCRPITLNFEILAPSSAYLLEAYSYLYHSEFDLDYFIKLISEEPSLVATLISRVNRHYRLVGKRISNLRHAIAYIGLDEVRKIFTTVVASNICDADKNILHDISLSRANFLEDVVQQIPVIIKKYEAYSVGLLSLFDALLRVDMNSLCTFMKLPPNIAAGLTERIGFWGDMITLCVSFENGQFSHAEKISNQYSLEYKTLQKLYWKNY